MPISLRDRRWKTADVPGPHGLLVLKKQCAEAASDLDEAFNALQRCERNLSLIAKSGTPLGASAAQSSAILNRIREELTRGAFHQVHRMESDAYDLASGQVVTAEVFPDPAALRKAKELSVKADEATKRAQALDPEAHTVPGKVAEAEKAAYEAHTEAAQAWLAVRLPPGKTPTPEAQKQRAYHTKRYYQHYEAWMHSKKR